MWNCLGVRMTGGNLRTWCMAKSFITAGFVLLFVFLAMPAHAEKGQLAYKQGTDLEARKNYEGAYEAYQKAYDADPRNTRYRAALTPRRSPRVTHLYSVRVTHTKNRVATGSLLVSS